MTAKPKFTAVAEFRGQKPDSERKGPGRPVGGKYRNPEYEQTTLFLSKKIKRAAQRKLLEEGPYENLDLSELANLALSRLVEGK